MQCPVVGYGGVPSAEQQADRGHCEDGEGEAEQAEQDHSGGSGGAGRPRQRRAG